MVSNVPRRSHPPAWIATGCPSPAARSSQSLRISPKPAHCPRCRETRPRLSDSSANSSSAPTWTPSAASEVAGVGVPSGAATTLVPIPTTTARPIVGLGLRFQQYAGEFLRPARTSLGHFSENFMSSDPADRSDASALFAGPPPAQVRRQTPGWQRPGARRRWSSRMLVARLPRGAIQGRFRRPRPAVCSEVTNQVGPCSPSRARASASGLVEPIWSKAASR